MISNSIFVYILFTFNLISRVASKYNDTIDASTCVDPDGYTACLDQVVTSSTTCVKDAADADQVMGCGCFDYSSQIACAASHCWNRVLNPLWESSSTQLLNASGLRLRIPIPSRELLLPLQHCDAPSSILASTGECTWRMLLRLGVVHAGTSKWFCDRGKLWCEFHQYD